MKPHQLARLITGEKENHMSQTVSTFKQQNSDTSSATLDLARSCSLGPRAIPKQLKEFAQCFTLADAMS